MKTHGNPTMYATWEDEGLNKKVRDLAGALHSHTFERRLLSQMNAKGTSSGSKAASSKRKYSWDV